MTSFFETRYNKLYTDEMLTKAIQERINYYKDSLVQSCKTWEEVCVTRGKIFALDEFIAVLEELKGASDA